MILLTSFIFFSAFVFLPYHSLATEPEFLIENSTGLKLIASISCYYKEDNPHKSNMGYNDRYPVHFNPHQILKEKLRWDKEKHITAWTFLFRFTTQDEKSFPITEQDNPHNFSVMTPDLKLNYAYKLSMGQALHFEELAKPGVLRNCIVISNLGPIQAYKKYLFTQHLFFKVLNRNFCDLTFHP